MSIYDSTFLFWYCVAVAALLGAVLSDFEMEYLERSPIAYRCNCSRDRMERALISLGRNGLREVLDQQGGAELSCQFCGKVERFTRRDLEELLASMEASAE